MFHLRFISALFQLCDSFIGIEVSCTVTT